jgi:dCTP deaminase
VLGKDDLIDKLRDDSSDFAVTPILDETDQIGEGTIDVRLGPDLIVTKRTTGLAVYDPARADEIADELGDYQSYVRRPLGAAFYLHPGEFVIARTLEYIRLSDSMAAQAIGRSSWGRLGLIIATATMVHPGFAGTITLELSNVGTVPIVLYVGVRIAQLAFYET